MPTDPGQATRLEAVGPALDSERDRAPDVIVTGEDVDQFGGAFSNVALQPLTPPSGSTAAAAVIGGLSCQTSSVRNARIW